MPGNYINRRTSDGTLTPFEVPAHLEEMLKVEEGTSTIITENQNIIAIPTFTYHKSIGDIKTVFDSMADAMNHPNDYGHNINAQLVLYTLGIKVCNHNSTKVVGKTSSTCTKTGYTGDLHCNDCGTVVKGKTIAKAKHQNTKVTTKNATLSANGYKLTECKVCGKDYSKTTYYYPKTIKLSTTTYTYNGKVKKPSVKVTGSNGKTISSSNYTVSYASGRKNPGKYKVTIKFKDNYEGTKTLYFTIKPKKASLSSVKSTAKKKMTVKWSKQSKVTGYQITYATNSKFTKGKKNVTVKGASSKSKTIKSLKSKKTYYVKVRAYKTIDGKKVYGSYSKTKKVKVK